MKNWDRASSEIEAKNYWKIVCHGMQRYAFKAKLVKYSMICSD